MLSEDYNSSVNILVGRDANNLIILIGVHRRTNIKMPSCTGCRSLRVDDALKLYSPTVVGNVGTGKNSFGCTKKLGCRGQQGGCEVVCNLAPNCCDQFKAFWKKNCDIPVLLLRRYEDQPWFKNRLVQREWKAFVDQLVTPANIGCRLCPGPDDWQFKCHKARALIGPTIPCVWDLPEQDECASTQYGINRDWRRYNEDQRIQAGDILCGCNSKPVCCPKPRCEYPPYMGKKYGPRYMAWGNPSSMMFPRRQVFNYMSIPKC